MSNARLNIHNIAIIAHVDHGKTTLTDVLMRQTGMSGEGVTMDTNDLERERGITIYSKNTSVFYKGRKINIVDTPGHADFGSEVERVLRAIDSVLLVVDAQEGPMPQTKFVLKKSLELGIKPIVVINKIDKPAADPARTHDEVLELFMDLGANDEQLDFTTLYAIGRDGIAKRRLQDASKDLTPLLDTIIAEVPPASSDEALHRPVRLQPFNLAYDDYVGRMAISRMVDGILRDGDRVFVKKRDGSIEEGKIIRLFSFEGLNRKVVDEVYAGDIVMIAGLPTIDIGETVCADPSQEALPSIEIDEPTISLNFLVNNSPFSGRDGTLVTNSQLRQRLERELEVNVGLRIDFSANDRYKVDGRGVLHISILLENMRREGYEVQVSQPKVIMKEIGGVKHEPFEEVIVEVPEKMSGVVIEKLSRRKGTMVEMQPVRGNTRMVFEIPTRGLFGYREEFIIDTRGEGIMYGRVVGFRPHVGEIERHTVGSMVSMATGKALAYSLFNLQERGVLYIESNTEVYEGMVIGNTAKGNDMQVNAIRGKHLTNIRAAGSDENIRLTPPLDLTIERGLGLMNDDEFLEVTPNHVRMRKEFLKKVDRVRSHRARASAAEA